MTSLTQTSFKISQSSSDFINVVVNPLDSNKPAQVPDMQQFNSLCLTDSAHVTNPVNYHTGDIMGIVVWLRCHYSEMDSLFNNNPNRIYSLCYATLDSSNKIILNGSTKNPSIVPINMSTIIGGNSYTDELALITSCRVMSMGLQLLSTIETVTSTTVNYLTQIVSADRKSVV